VVKAGYFLNGSCLYKITGRDWIDNFCRLAVGHQLRVYILAGKPGILSLANQRLKDRYPSLEIVGFSDGFFIGKSECEVLREIDSVRPHVVFVGKGIPQQEKWVWENREEINAPVCWSVGALFDYVAGLESPVPEWMDKIALEWLWRLMIDPGGKWKRYLVGNPLFVLRILHRKLVPVKD
jgi:N-acetylglucosaminyldiphosphoundecaprenol N-acetyl-beta-D-mannosaminyltransferase